MARGVVESGVGNRPRIADSEVARRVAECGSREHVETQMSAHVCHQYVARTAIVSAAGVGTASSIVLTGANIPSRPPISGSNAFKSLFFQSKKLRAAIVTLALCARIIAPGNRTVRLASLSRTKSPRTIGPLDGTAAGLHQTRSQAESRSARPARLLS